MVDLKFLVFLVIVLVTVYAIYDLHRDVPVNGSESGDGSVGGDCFG
jgi:hypothetical protein